MGVFAAQRRRGVTRTITVERAPPAIKSWTLKLEVRHIHLLTDTTMPQHLPPEIEEIIIDHFHNDPKTLKQCSLVSRSWAACAQKHLFNEVDFMRGSGYKMLKLWKKSFPDLSNSPACHTKLLSIEYKTSTAVKNLGFIGSFTNVTHLEVDADDCCYGPRSNVWHNLLPAVTSLCVYFSTVKLSQLFGLVYSFPSVKDLVIEGISIVYDGGHFPPSTLPEFTGTLVLDCQLKDITWTLLYLPPGSLRFRRIVWKIDSSHDKDKVKHMKNLMEKCSDTLEYIDFTYCMGGESHPFGSCDGFSTQRGFPLALDPTMTPLDLSKATKLKGVAFRLDREHMKWFTESLKTIPSEKKGFEEVLIRFAGHWDDPKSREVGGERNQQCKDFENALVRLSELGGVRTRAVWHSADEWRGEERMRNLFPEMMKRGKMESIYLGVAPSKWRPVVEERCLRLRRYNKFWERDRNPVDDRIF